MYPRHLNLKEETRKELVSWLDSELINHLGERTELIDKLKRYQSDYLAEPSTEVATFPFLGASTIIIPLTAIAVEAVHSRTMQTAFAHDQLVNVKIKNPADEELEPELERYLHEELIVGASFKESVEPAILELEKLGTGIIETQYCYHSRKGIRSTEKGEEEFEVIFKNGPSFSSVPVSQFLLPFDCLDLQSARWCGKVFSLTEHEVKFREADGYFLEGTYDKLKNHFIPPTSDIDNATSYMDRVEAITKTDPSWPTDLQFYWIATTWEIVPGRFEEIFVIFQRDIQDIVGIWYNWYEDLRRPFAKGVYFPQEFRWYGIGIGKQNEQFQYEVTTQHRSRLDNATIANMRMFKVKRNSSIKENEPIFPGKFWFLDEMDDLQPLEMGDVKSSAYNNENQAVIFSQQRNGVNELTLGMPNTGTPGTATSEMSRIQESARKFDYSYGNIRTLLDESLHHGLLTIAQWGPSVSRLEFNPKGNKIASFLKSPFEYFRDKILLEIHLANQNQNKFRDRQDATQLVGTFQQYYTNLLALAEGNPQLTQQIQKGAMDGANLAMRHIMESFDIRNPDRFLVNFSLPQPVTPNDPSQLGGGTTPVSGSNASTGVQSNLILAPNAASILPNLPGLSGQLG